MGDINIESNTFENVFDENESKDGCQYESVKIKQQYSKNPFENVDETCTSIIEGDTMISGTPQKINPEAESNTDNVVVIPLGLDWQKEKELKGIYLSKEKHFLHLK